MEAEYLEASFKTAEKEYGAFETYIEKGMHIGKEEREILAQLADSQDASAEGILIKLRQCKELIDDSNCLSNIEINLLLSDPNP